MKTQKMVFFKVQMLLLELLQLDFPDFLFNFFLQNWNEHHIGMSENKNWDFLWLHIQIQGIYA